MIYYDDLYKNAYNKNWEGWKEVKEIMFSIEQKGSRSFKHPTSPIKHAFEYLNNYLLEKEVKRVMNLKFIKPESHECLYDRVGEDILPDFIDCKGKTFDMKCRWELDDAEKLNYHGADHKMIYRKANNTLYGYDEVLGSFVEIQKINARYIDTKNYPFKDEELGR